MRKAPPGPERGLVFDPRPLRLVAAGAVGRVSRPASLYAFSPLRLRSLPEPELPGAGWLRLRPLHVGVCGSDLHEACLDAAVDNPLSGLITFPHVLGHETVARLTTAAAPFAPGAVVAV
ncbi:MAG: zinc-dependent alcohol dehydrogenase, partial [Candidatus Dormibacterales bacterium]